MKKYIKRLIFVGVTLGFVFAPAAAYAALTPTFNQTINAGTLSADIYQSDDSTPVASPTVAFPTKTQSFSCQTSAATLGDTNNKVNVTNLSSTVNTWNIAIAATAAPASANWSNGTQTYKMNDATGSGCTNGQLTVDPSVATLTDDCSGSCTANDATVSKGSSTAFNHGTSTDSVTLLSDSAGTNWEGYLTGIGLSQKIPAMQHSGAYSLGMTITLSST